jgi:RHS repeat-associated protein
MKISSAMIPFFYTFRILLCWCLLTATWPVAAYSHDPLAIINIDNSAGINPDVNIVQVSATSTSQQINGVVIRRTNSPITPEKTTVSVECDRDRSSLESAEILNVTKSCAGFTVRTDGPIIVEVPFDPSLFHRDVADQAVKLFKVEQVASAQAVIQPVAAYMDVENKRTITTVGEAVAKYMNGVIKSGEASTKPASNFEPSLLESTKKADSLGLQAMVRKPKPGPNGDLVLDYPIDFRGLREDFRPSVSVGYSSAAGYGTLGEGWNLSVPQITVETRWGVPAFDKNKETETYLFNGEQLVPAQTDLATELDITDQPHRTEGLQDRTSPKLSFVLKRSDGLWTFTRHGDAPDKYNWEASQKNTESGKTRFYYFGNVSTRHKNYLPADVQADELNHPFLDVGAEARGAAGYKPIVLWALKREIDAVGNIVDYDWARDCRLGGIVSSPISNACAGAATGNVSSNEIYLRRIVYYGSTQEETLVADCQSNPSKPSCITPENPTLRYEVILGWSNTAPADYIRSDARSGGMIIGGRVLKQISTRMIRNQGGPVHRPVWACSLPFATQTFGYNEETYNGGTGRQLLATATHVAAREPLLGFETFTTGQCEEPSVKSPAELAGYQPTRFEYGGDTEWTTAELASGEALPNAPGIGGQVKSVMGWGDNGPYSSNLLGSTAVGESGGSFYGGIGFLGIQKLGTFGVKAGFQQRNSYQELTSIIDLSGDGIPDRVLRDGPGSFRVQKGSVSGGVLSFGTVVVPKGMPDDMQREPVQTTRHNAFEGHLPGGIYLSSGQVSSTAMQDVYPADIDGDRRVDIVYGGTIFYNRSTAEEIRFDPNPADSFFGPKVGEFAFRPLSLPMVGTDVYDDLMADDIPIVSKDHPRIQVVRRWVAPFDGDVIVDLSARLRRHDPPAPKADGVLVSIQRRGAAGAVKVCDLAALLPHEATKVLAPTETCSTLEADASKAIFEFLGKEYPDRRFAAISVKKGEELYFAAHPNFNAEQDVVEWNPMIAYANLLEDEWDTNGTATAKAIFGYKLTQPGEPGLEAVLSSLLTVLQDDPRRCGMLTVKDAADPAGTRVSEQELGLCDPTGNSYVRYTPGLDINAFADAAGALSSPMRGIVHFGGRIKKPRTLFPMKVWVSVVHPSIYTDSTNPEEDLLRTCRSRQEPDSVASLPREEGEYQLDFNGPDRAVYEGSLVCAQVRTDINPEWARDPRTLEAWHEDLSNFIWIEPLSVEYFSKFIEYNGSSTPTPPVKAGETADAPVACGQNADPAEKCPDVGEVANYIVGKNVETPTETVPAPGQLMLIKIHRPDLDPVETLPIAPSINMSFGSVVRNEANADPANDNSAVRLHQRVLELALPESLEVCTLFGMADQKEYRLAIPFYTRGHVPAANNGVSSIGNIVTSLVLRSRLEADGTRVDTREHIFFSRYRVEKPKIDKPDEYEIRPLSAGEGLYPQVGERQIDDVKEDDVGLFLQQVMATTDKAGTDVVTSFSRDPGVYAPAASETVGLRFCAPRGATITVETHAVAPQKVTDKENADAIARFAKLWSSADCVPDAAGGGQNACRITGGAILLGFKGGGGETGPGLRAGSSIYLPRNAIFDPHSPRGASWFSAKAEMNEKAIPLTETSKLEDLVRVPNALADTMTNAQDALCSKIGAGGGCGGVKNKNSVSDGTGGGAGENPGVDVQPLIATLTVNKISAEKPGDLPANCQTEALSPGVKTPAGTLCGNGPDRSIWIRGAIMSASRVGLKDLTNRRCVLVQNLLGGDINICDPGYLGPSAIVPLANPVGLRALPRSSKTQSQTTSIGGWGAGGTSSTSSTQASTDLIDLNGDGYPDQVTGEKVMLTGPLGLYRNGASDTWNGLGSVNPTELVTGRSNPRKSVGATSQFNLSFSSTKAQVKTVSSGNGTINGNATGTPARFGTTTVEPNFSFSPPGLSFGANASLKSYEFLDINGDGLPDRISTESATGNKADCRFRKYPTNGKLELDGDCVLSVELNKGYALSAPRLWSSGSDGVPMEKSQNFGIGIQAGYGGTENRLDYAGGLGADVGASRGFQILTDINGDGLPDLVSNDNDTLRARLNNGHGFGGKLDIGHISGGLFGMGSSETDNAWIGGFFLFGFWIPLTPIFVVFNPGVQQSNTLSRQTIAVRDFNGDGLADIARGGAIASGNLGFSNKTATVFYNGLGKRNLLRRVFQATNTNANANLEFDFDRTGLTNDDPSNHWVLSRLVERDGVMEDDSGFDDNARTTCITYGHGRFDRYERRFLGFDSVGILEGCRDNGSSFDRKIERRYANWSDYETGLLLEENIAGPSGAASRATTNRYILIDLAASASNSNDNAGDVACLNLPGHDYPKTPLADAVPDRRFDLPVCKTFEVALSDNVLTKFDAGGRSLQPFLVASELTSTEDQVSGRQATTALAYRPDHLGRVILTCDYGQLDVIGDDVCSNIEYADHVMVSVRYNAGGTGVSVTPALGLVAATTVEVLRQAGKAGKTKASIVRGTTASYETSTGRLVKTCSFINPRNVAYDYLSEGGDENPCEDHQTFPKNTDQIVKSTPLTKAIAETYFRYGERGNLEETISPLSAAGDYARKQYKYDRYLGQVGVEESTVFCRVENAGVALQISKFAAVIESKAKEQQAEITVLKPGQLALFKATDFLGGGIQFFAEVVAGECLAGSSVAPNVEIPSDSDNKVPAMGAFVTNSYGIDYRLARTSVALDANRNMTMTDWDGYGRPLTIKASWAGYKDGTASWADYGFGGGGDESTEPVEKPDFGLLASFNYPATSFAGPVARLQQYVDPNVYGSTNDESGKRTISTNFLFDQMGGMVQSIADADACSLRPDIRPTTICDRKFSAIASGLVKKDSLGRDVMTGYSVGVETRPDATALKIIDDPALSTLKLIYDEFDRPTRVSNPDGNTYEFVYRLASTNVGAAVAHETYTRNANCVPTRVTRDIRGNIVSVTEYWHQSGKNGSLIEAVQLGSSYLPQQADMRSPWIANITGDRQQIATCKKSLSDEVAALENPGTNGLYAATTAYDYDALGQLSAVRQPSRCNFFSSGQISLCTAGEKIAAKTTTRVGYDAFGRRVWIDDADGGFTFNALDLVSNPVCKLSGGFVGSNVVDADALAARCKSNNPLSEEITRIVKTSYLFNLATTVKYQPSAPDVMIQYGGPGEEVGKNTRGRIVYLKDGSGKTDAMSYDALGQSRELTRTYALGNTTQKLTTSFERDAWGKLHVKQLEGAFRPLSGGTSIEAKIAIAYTYNPLGSITSVHTGPDRLTPNKAAVLVDAGFDERSNNVFSIFGTGVTTVQSFDGLSNRLTHLQSLMGQWCNPLGSVCADPAPPIAFQSISYDYDPGGNIVHYVNQALDAAKGQPAIDPIRWGVMVNRSEASFSYDELNRLARSKTTATLAYKPPYEPYETLDDKFNKIKTVGVSTSEQFASTSLNEMGQWLRVTDKTNVSPKQTIGAKYNYSANKVRHAPEFIDMGNQSRTPTYDGLGRLYKQRCQYCSKQTYDWNADDTIRLVKTALDPLDSEFERDHLLTEMTYDRGGQRASRSSYYVEEDEPSTLQNRVLYTDENLSVYFPRNGTPSAMWHFFAGSYRLASQWAGQDGMFTYHPTLANQNSTDVVFGERDHGGHARVYQQLGYGAYGEVLNKRTATYALDTRAAQNAKDLATAPAWRFNGKELDESTGLTYFGARYYDSRTALWLSADPALADYLSGEHGGGVYAPRNLASYGFGWGNPINVADFDGRTADDLALHFDSDADRMYYTNDEWIHSSGPIVFGYLNYDPSGAGDPTKWHLDASPRTIWASQDGSERAVGVLPSIDLTGPVWKGFIAPKISVFGVVGVDYDSGDGTVGGTIEGGVGAGFVVGLPKVTKFNAGAEVIAVAGNHGLAVGALATAKAGPLNGGGGVEWHLNFGGKVLRAVGDLHRNIERRLYQQSW